MVMDGRSLQDINQEDPGFVMMNLAKIQSYAVQVQAWKQQPTKTWASLASSTTLSPGLNALVVWLNNNLGQERPLRKKQLLLSSPPGVGKTWLTEKLGEYFRIYKHPGGKWFDGFDPSHDIIVFDEFVSQVPCSLMNRVVDGQHTLLEIKGGTVPKSKNVPVMVLTNLHPFQIYPNVSDRVREAFFSRFEHVELAEDDNPWKLWENRAATPPASPDGPVYDGDFPPISYSPRIGQHGLVYSDAEDIEHLCPCGQEYEACGAVGCICRHCGEPHDMKKYCNGVNPDVLLCDSSVEEEEIPSSSPASDPFHMNGAYQLFDLQNPFLQ
jgi:hypothetical protein